MDLNQLLFAHQLAMIGQTSAPDRARRAAYDDTLALLAGRISRLRTQGGAAMHTVPFVVGEPIPAYRDR